MTNTHQQLNDLMRSSFGIDNVVDDYKDRFEQDIKNLIGKVDADIEKFQDPEQQRDLSIKFRWGHNHDFGSFKLDGQMGDRHINIIADFINYFDLPFDLSGKKVLDVGAWTGGISLVLSAMGAEVYALEEVVKYSSTINYLASAFDIKTLKSDPISLYKFDEHDIYDYIIYSGVIYHVTDPVLSLRILFNALNDAGKIYIETFGINPGNNVQPLAVVEGPRNVRGGTKEELNRGGWNYFLPSKTGLYVWMDTAGFEDIRVSDMTANNRIYSCGTRKYHKDILRAGLSRPDIR